MSLIILFTISATLSGQQYAQYSLFMFDKYQENPAFAGLDYGLSINIHTRNQWNGLERAPSIININAHMPYYNFNGAIGISTNSRSLGVQSYKDISVSYNYVLNMGSGLWSNGLRVGLGQLQVDGGAIVTPEGIYNAGNIIHNDPLLLSTSDIGLGLVWDIGTYYMSSDWEFGIAIKGLPGNNINQKYFVLNKKISASVFAQYKFVIFEKFDFQPSIMLKSNFNQVQTELASIIKINGNVFGGIGIRGYNSNSLDAVMVILGANVSDKIRITYNYDAGVSKLRNVNEGSHELHLNYNFGQLLGKGMPPRKVYNPRYL